MFSALIHGFKTRRNARRAGAQRAARSQKPLIEEVESRALMTSLVLIDNPSVVEGTGGANTPMKFTVSLTSPSASPVTVHYQTVAESATANLDFIPVSGTLTFSPGQTSAQVTVPIVADSIIENTELVGLQLSNATNAYIWESLGNGSIIDDDTPVAAALSIGDVSMTRGLSGTKTMNFTVSLTGPQQTPVTLTAATRNGSAIAGLDFQAKSQAITFNPGETTKTFSVTIYGTSVACSDKIFGVTLSNASVAISRSIAAGTERFGA